MKGFIANNISLSYSLVIKLLFIMQF